MVVIALGAVAIDYAFRSLLTDAARSSLTATVDEIQRTVVSATNFPFGGPPLVIALSDRASLDRWASPSTYVQIDTPAGQVVGKSSNLAAILPPMPDLAQNGRIREVDLAHIGRALLIDHVLTDASGSVVAVAHVAESLAVADTLGERARAILLVVAIVAMLGIAAASYVIAATAIDPIERLTGAVAEIGSERLDRRLRWRRADEVGRLAAAFDAMLDRLQSAFARERQFISDASHELRTPLTVINANAQLLRRWGDRDAEVRATSLAAIVDESDRLAGIVSGMLTLSKAESGDAIPKEPLVLERLVAGVVEHLRERAAAKDLVLEAVLPAGQSSIVAGDAGLLRQLVANLIDNAIKFTERGTVSATVRPNGATVAIEVSDTGPGIVAGEADRLFDRFFRGDPSHARTVEGTGLGLAIVRSIARVHGGSVDAAPRPEGGSRFTVTLPREPESLSPPS